MQKAYKQLWKDLWTFIFLQVYTMKATMKDLVEAVEDYLDAIWMHPDSTTKILETDIMLLKTINIMKLSLPRSEAVAKVREMYKQYLPKPKWSKVNDIKRIIKPNFNSL